MRWEIMRESQEDYELLLMAEKAGLDSKAFCGRIVTNATDFAEDPDTFYEVRHRLLAELSQRNLP